jgi:hypothetical protein
VWRGDWQGGSEAKTFDVTCYDPLVRTAGRMVYDSVGRVSAWDFGDGITAGELVQQIFENSVHYEDVPAANPRVFPIDYSSGDFSASTDASEMFAVSPLDIASLLLAGSGLSIADAGICDIVLAPTEVAAGAQPGVLGVLSAVDMYGADKTGIVHFDYDTGDRNCIVNNRSIDMATVCNKLRYLLGPPNTAVGPNHWYGSVESSDQAKGIDQAYQDAEYASRQLYGTLAAYRVFDSDAYDVRALYRALWKSESTLRVWPQELLNLSPTSNCAFEPFVDYSIGDIVAINTSDEIGPAISNAAQRIYGFDVTVDVNGVERVKNMINSPNAVV